MNIEPLLQKYFKGECTEAEQQVAERYLAAKATPELDALFLQAWESIDPKIKQMPMRAFKWWRIAAAILVLVAGAATAWQFGHQRSSRRQLALLTWDTLTNKGNALQRYHLPDGSVVWLNAYSAIIYNEGYGEHNRELWLKGEAYFEVAQQASHPFQVHTAAVTTTALGTSFSIATGNHADNSIEVSLLTGRVAVSTTTFRKELSPGQMLVYNDADAPAIAAFHEANVMDWKSGKLILDKVNMADAFARLQQRYGCRIVLEDSSLAHKKISGTFGASQSLEQVMLTLKYVHDFKYIRVDDHTYVIRKHA